MNVATHRGVITRILLSVTIVLFSFGVKAQAPVLASGTTPAAATKPAAAPVVKGAAVLIDNFFKKYKEDGTSAAIDYLFGTNKLFANNAQISLLKQKLDSLRIALGPFNGRELIVQKTAAPSLVFYSYLVKHENQPLRFTFMFYKPKNDWVLYRFKFDDQIDSELEQAGRIDMKRP